MKRLTKDEYWAIEYVKCRNNILYFIDNYVKIPEIGGTFDYKLSKINPKLIRTIKSTIKWHRTILMATRQLGKSTVAGILIEWAMNFFPGNRAVILNMRKGAAQENLAKVKYIHNNLPRELLSLNPFKHKGNLKTYTEYANGSRVDTFYPSSMAGPEQLARSLTAPILYIDEVAYIRHIEDGYTSAQPVLSAAREQAKRNGFPYFILFTSTPNGTFGSGQFFYSLWNNSIDSEELFENKADTVETKETKEIINSPTKNGFIRVKYHWSEDETKDNEWYAEQKKELNFNTRAINQELDLLFVGGTDCIFDDDYLSALSPIKPLEVLDLPHYSKLKIYANINPLDYYLIGIDTARSLTGDFCAIEVFSYSNFEQIAEFFNRLGSLTKFTDVIKVIVKDIASRTNNRIILAIEENSIGAAIIENLIDATDFDYNEYIYSAIGKPDKNGGIGTLKKGINTNVKTKETMVSVFYDYICNDASLIKSSDLIDQLSIIEKKVNGSIAAQRGHHDDLFMASCMCAYIKKLSALEYGPLINYSEKILLEKRMTMLDNLTSSSKGDLAAKEEDLYNKYVYQDEDQLNTESEENQEINTILPLIL